MGEDDYSWLTDIFSGGSPSFGSDGGGSSVDVGADPGGGSGNSGWNINPDGSFTGPDGTQYRADGTPLDPNGPGSGANSPSGGGSGFSLSDIVKGLGGPGGIASILGPLLSGAYQMNQNRNATNQLKDASKQANDLVSGMYQPYVTAGNTALGNAQADVFKPLGARRLGDMISR